MKQNKLDNDEINTTNKATSNKRKQSEKNTIQVLNNNII